MFSSSIALQKSDWKRNIKNIAMAASLAIIFDSICIQELRVSSLINSVEMFVPSRDTTAVFIVHGFGTGFPHQQEMVSGMTKLGSIKMCKWN